MMTLEQQVRATKTVLRLQLAFDIERLEMELGVVQLDADGDGRYFQELKALRWEGLLA